MTGRAGHGNLSDPESKSRGAKRIRLGQDPERPSCCLPSSSLRPRISLLLIVHQMSFSSAYPNGPPRSQDNSPSCRRRHFLQRAHHYRRAHPQAQPSSNRIASHHSSPFALDPHHPTFPGVNACFDRIRGGPTASTLSRLHLVQS